MSYTPFNDSKSLDACSSLSASCGVLPICSRILRYMDSIALRPGSTIGSTATQSPSWAYMAGTNQLMTYVLVSAMTGGCTAKLLRTSPRAGTRQPLRGDLERCRGLPTPLLSCIGEPH